MKINSIFDAAKESKSSINFELAEISDQRTSLRTIDAVANKKESVVKSRTESVQKETEIAISGANLDNLN